MKHRIHPVEFLLLGIIVLLVPVLLTVVGAAH